MNGIERDILDINTARQIDDMVLEKEIKGQAPFSG